jgi:hypothetical protein
MLESNFNVKHTFILCLRSNEKGSMVASIFPFNIITFQALVEKYEKLLTF